MTTKPPRSTSKRSQGKSSTDRSNAERVTGSGVAKKSAAGRTAPAKRVHHNERNKQSGRRPQAQDSLPKRSSPGKANREYAIGKGKPPSEYSWKPGQSGNARGRPKGRKNEATIWKEILGRKVTVPIGGKPKRITLQEAIQYRIANDALTGNIKSAGFILNRFAMTVTGELPAADMNEDDRAVLEAFARRLNDHPPEN